MRKFQGEREINKAQEMKKQYIQTAREHAQKTGNEITHLQSPLLSSGVLSLPPGQTIIYSKAYHSHKQPQLSPGDLIYPTGHSYQPADRKGYGSILQVEVDQYVV